MFLVEAVSGNGFPVNIPPGSLVTNIDVTNNILTIDKPAFATASAFTARTTTDLIEYHGGVPVDIGGNQGISCKTVGNSVNPPTASRMGTSPYAIEFMTDVANFNTTSAAILFKLSQNGVTPNVFRIAVDDQYINNNASEPTAFGASEWVTLQFGVPGIHKVRIELTSGLLFQQIWATSPARIWRPTYPLLTRAAIAGPDSFMDGGAAGSFGPRNMAFQLSHLMGWIPDIEAVSGTGYFSNGSTNYSLSSPQRAADFKRRSRGYDLAVFLGSVNDNGQSQVTMVSAYVQAWINVRAALGPNAPFFIFGVPTNKAISAAAATTLEGYMATAFSQWGDPNAYLFPITTDPDGAWVTVDGSAADNSSIYVASDNNHPPDPVGMNYYALRMQRCINGVLGV